MPHNTACLPQELVGSSTAMQPTNRKQLPAFDINGCAVSLLGRLQAAKVGPLWTPSWQDARARTRQEQRERRQCTTLNAAAQPSQVHR